MVVEKKLAMCDFAGMEWQVVGCRVTGCRVTRVAGGARSEIHGFIVLSAGSAKVRFRWRASQTAADDRAVGLLTVEQEYKSMPVLSGVLLVAENGEPLVHEQQTRMAQRTINSMHEKWDSKVRYVVQLFQ